MNKIAQKFLSNKGKRLWAVMLALTVLITSFHIVISGTARNESEEVIDWIDASMDTAYFYNVQGTSEHLWWPEGELVTIKNGLNGGLNFTFKNAITNVREGLVSNKRPLHGFKTILNNFKPSNKSGDNEMFALLFGQVDVQEYANNNGTLAIVFDIGKGKVLAYPSGEVVLENENLLSNNIQGKEIAIKFKENTRQDFLMYITIDDVALPEALINSSIIKNSGLDIESTSFTFSAWNEGNKKQNFSIDLMGIGSIKTDKIDAVSYITPSLDNAYFYNKEKKNPNLWWETGKEITISNSQGGGLNFQWKNAMTNVREGIMSNGISLNGYKAIFTNLQVSNFANQGKFAIYLTGVKGANFYGKGDVLALAFDTHVGSITAYPNNELILTSEKLKKANIRNKKFGIEIRATSTDDFAVFAIVEDEIVEKGKLHSDVISQIESFDVDYCHTVISSWNGINGSDAKQTMSLDLIGIGNVITETYDADKFQIVIPKKENGIIYNFADKLWDKDKFSTENLSNNEGVKYVWNDCSDTCYEGINATISLDGLTLILDNYERKSGTSGKLQFNISSRINKNVSLMEDSNLLALVLDTDKGTITANHIINGDVKNSVSLIKNNELLKYDNIKQKVFQIKFNREESGYTLSVVIDNSTIRGELLTDDFVSKISDIIDKENVLITISPVANESATSSIEYIGLGLVDEWGRYGNHNYVTSKDILKSGTGLSVSNSISAANILWNNSKNNASVGTKTTTNMDGLVVRLDKLNFEPGKPYHFALMLGNSTSNSSPLKYETTNAPLTIAFLSNGSVIIPNYNNYEIIEKNENLKGENLRGRKIEVAFNKLDNDRYLLSIMAGSKYVSGIIPKEALKASKKLFDEANVEVALTVLNGENELTANWFNIDYCGFTTSKLYKLIYNIQNIGDITIEKRDVINSMLISYSMLIEGEKSKVFNYNELLEASNKFDNLVESLINKKIARMNLDSARLFNKSENYPTYQTAMAWKSSMNVSNSPTGGLRYVYNNATVNMREGYCKNIPLDGLEIYFDKFDSFDNNSKQFAIMFGSSGIWGSSHTGWENNSALILVVDAVNGRIVSYPSESVVLEDANLKYENINNKRFSIGLDENNDENCYDISFTIGNYNAVGKLPFEDLNKSGGLKNVENCSIVISPWNSNQNFMIDFVGLLIEESNVNSIISKIDNLVPITLDKANEVTKLMQEYEALPERLKDLVVNYESLNEFNAYLNSFDSERIVYQVTNAIKKLSVDGVDYDSGSEISKITKRYECLTDSQKKQVINYSDFEKAKEKYSNLIKSIYKYESYLELFGVKRINKDLMKDSFGGKLTTKELDDYSWKFVWDNSDTTLKNGVSSDYTFDGLTYSIKNLTKPSDKKGVKLAMGISHNGISHPDADETENLTLVLDTENGEVLAYPGNISIIKSEKLEHVNIEGKQLRFEICSTEYSAFYLRIIIDDAELIGYIPSSIIDKNKGLSSAENVKVLFSPWVEDEMGRRDNSRYSFSMELSGMNTAYVLAEFYKKINDLNMFVENFNSKITDDNAIEIEQLIIDYAGFGRKGRKLITDIDGFRDITGKYYEYNLDYVDYNGEPLIE